MKRMLIILIMLIPPIYMKGEAGKDTLVVMFWNLENLFDYHDGGTGPSDREFSSSGSRRWAKRRFYSKCDKVAKAVTWIADKYSRMPDIIGLCEVENRNVLYKLLNDSILRKYDYQIVHYDSADKRGIDTALLFRK